MGERKEKPLTLESAVQLDKRDVEELIKKEKEKEKEKGAENSNKEKEENEVEEVEEKGNAERLPVILKKTRSSSFLSSSSLLLGC